MRGALAPTITIQAQRLTLTKIDLITASKLASSVTGEGASLVLMESGLTVEAIVNANQTEVDALLDDKAAIAGGTSANFTAMPQVGGDPIVESGSNADGEWTRWADGTQICRYVIGQAIVSIGLSSGYYFESYSSKSYSQPFIDTVGSYVSSYISVDSVTSMLDTGTEGNTGITGGAWPSFVIKSLISFNTTGRIMRLAIGRWK